MIEKSQVARVSVETVAKICDRCGRRAEVQDADFEFCEFLSISRVGVYGSVIGDGAKVEVDICQHCLTELLLPFARVSRDEP